MLPSVETYVAEAPSTARGWVAACSASVMVRPTADDTTAASGSGGGGAASAGGATPIAAMAGAIAGACQGAGSFPPDAIAVIDAQGLGLAALAGELLVLRGRPGSQER